MGHGREQSAFECLPGGKLTLNETARHLGPTYEPLGDPVARIGEETKFALSKAVASRNALEHGTSEFGHFVQNFLVEFDLGNLPGKAACFKLGTDDDLPTADLRFYPAALVVPCCRLPGHAAVAADLGNTAIPNARIMRRLRADNRVLRRRYDNVDGLPMALPQQNSC